MTTHESSGWPRFGAFSFGFGAHQLHELVTGFSAMGLTGVQLGSDLMDNALARPETIPDTVGALAAAGIEIVGLAGYRNLVAVDDERRRQNISYLKGCLEIAAALGTTVVATETGTRNASDWQPDPENGAPATKALFYRALEELLPVAEQQGVVLALEPFVNNVVATLDDIDDVMTRYPSPSLGLVFDPFNLISSAILPEATATSLEFCQRWSDRFAIAHLKDVSARGAEVDTPAFGDGVFPHAALIPFLRDRRPDLVIVLEHIDVERIPQAISAFGALVSPGVSATHG